MNRRHFLQTAAAAGFLTGLGLPALAAAAPRDRKFIFVFNPGGWDPTRVFAPTFDLGVAMEPLAEPESRGDLTWVAHPERPSVSDFLHRHGDSTAFINGISVPSVAHTACTRIMMTGGLEDGQPDMASAISSAQADRYLLPGMVIRGPSFPAGNGALVTRLGTDGQLDRLITGSILSDMDQPTLRFTRETESLVDQYLNRRSQLTSARASTHQGIQATQGLATAHGRLGELKDVPISLRSYGYGFDAQRDLAVGALAAGVSRAVTLEFTGTFGGGTWDSHADNDNVQSGMFEDLFAQLSLLMQDLESRPGESEATLAEETVVVVLSEMGRTPLLNSGGGKDHWAWTSAMVVGPGIRGGRSYGAFDGGFTGMSVDMASGELSASGQTVTTETLGATLLRLADADPGAWSDESPLLGATG